jgi:hypothetical protein
LSYGFFQSRVVKLCASYQEGAVQRSVGGEEDVDGGRKGRSEEGVGCRAAAESKARPSAPVRP